MVEAIFEERGVLYCVQTKKTNISEESTKFQFGKDNSKVNQLLFSVPLTRI